MRRYRDKEKGVTKGVTKQGVTEGVTLLESQMKPLTEVPLKPDCVLIPGIRNPIRVRQAAKLLVILQELDKWVTGLDGKRVNLGDMVRLGVEGPTLAELKEILGG